MKPHHSNWNYIIFASSPHDDVSIDAAKAYARDIGLTSETARIRQVDNSTCVIVRDDNEWLMAKLRLSTI